MNYNNLTLANNDKLGLIGNLSTMLSAGIPILESVNSLLEDSKGNTQKVLIALRDDLSQGKRVYASFSRFPAIFDKVTVNIIRASEEAGTLDVTLKDLRQNIQKEIEFSDKIKSAMIYPLFIMVVFLGVLLLVLIVAVPKIATVFQSLKIDLPLPTKILIFLSHVLLTYTIQLVVGLVLITVGFVFLFRRKRNAVLNLLFSLPLISELVKQIDLTRFTRSLSLLLFSGLPITMALELSIDVVNKKETARIISNARDLVLVGKTMSSAFRQSKGYIPTIVIKLMEAGERTGSLDKSLQDISEHLDYEVSNTLKTLTALLEPLMLVLVGVVVGGMMFSIIAPIYGLVSQIHG